MAWSQVEFDAAADWTRQKRGEDARVFTPPDLHAGEIHSVAIYESAPLGGRSLSAWLKKFGGPVGTATGRVAKPLTIKSGRQGASAIDFHSRPNGSSLGAIFVALSLDGGRTVRAMRTLFSGTDVVDRYAADNAIAN